MRQLASWDEGVNRVPKWLLPTLSEVLVLSDPTWAVCGSGGEPAQQRRAGRMAAQRVRAEREWSGAIVSLTTLLQQKIQADSPGSESTGPFASSTPKGLVFSGPLPLLSHLELITNLSTWALTASSLNPSMWMPFQLLPAVEDAGAIAPDPTTPILPLLPGDPLASEQFCLVLTPWFSLVMVLGEGLSGDPAFMFSFLPEVAERAWEAIRPRILLTNSHQVDQLDDLIHQFAPIAPNYETVMQFSRLLLEHLPEPGEDGKSDPRNRSAHFSEKAVDADPDRPLPHSDALDVELLQAIAHEVRTPLTTIRTLTRSLLKRTDLSPDVLRRLEIIDRECSEQIDRFGLIFRAVELETDSTHSTAMSLTRTSVDQVFQQIIPRWKQQATQRSLTLEVVLPQKMPAVVSDPTMLDKALTSLIERFTRNLPAGSHIQVEVMLAGDQLKLQLQSQPESDDREPNSRLLGFKSQRQKPRPLKSIGQMLTFQPETGSLSLNLSVTKNLFQSLGGKLIVRDRPQQGEVMTVFLPLELSGPNRLDA